MTLEPARVSAALPTTMFEERSEQVYFLAPRLGPRFIHRVGEIMGTEFCHQSSAGVPAPSAHYLTTLYFDSETRAIARACASGGESVNLRARQYYDHDPELGIQREPLLWLEVKTHAGASTRKLRFAIPSDDVHACLRDGVITEPMLRFQRRNWGLPAQTVLQAIAELCRHTDGPLRPDCLAHYRRQAWQDAGETVRITLDTEVGFHHAPASLVETGMTGTTLSDAVADPPVASLPQCLVEIKLRRDAPAWLCQLITDMGLEPARDGQRPFSKFLAASHAVHAMPTALAAIHH